MRLLFQLNAKQGGECFAVKVCTNDAKAADDARRTLAHVGLARDVVEVDPAILACHDALRAKNRAVSIVGKRGECVCDLRLGEDLGGFSTEAHKHLVCVVVMMLVMVVTAGAMLTVLVVMFVVMVLVMVVATGAMLTVLVFVLVFVLVLVMMLMARAMLVVIMLVVMLVVVMLVVVVTAGAMLAMLVMMLVVVLVMMLVMVVMSANGAGILLFKMLHRSGKRVATLDGGKQLLARQLVPVGRDDHGILILLAAKGNGCHHLFGGEPLGVAQHDRARVCDLIAEEFTEVFEIHTALARIYDRNEGGQHELLVCYALYGTDDV